MTLLLPDHATVSPSRPRPRPLAPWSDGALAVLLGGWSIAAISLVLGWYGTSATGVVPDQIPWLDVAIAGAVLSGFGNVLWLTAGRRAVGERRLTLVSFGATAPAHLQQTPPATQTSAQTSAQDTALLTSLRVPGQELTHLPERPLIVGKVVELVAPGAGIPCRMCCR